MTLLNAPAYNAQRENRKRNLIVGGLSLAVLTGLLTLAGFILGHGWLFTNLPAEHRVSTLLTAVQAGDYAKGYGIWENDPEWQQHPGKYDYKLQRFTEDWSTASDWGGPVKTFHVDVSKRNKSGIVVAATINGKKRIFLYANKVDGTLGYFPNELEY